MKNKTTITTLSAIVALAIMAMSVYSQNNNFSAPQNMGATLNTASDETGPVMSPNGLSLYFSSNRAGGQGGVDIYVSHRATLSSAWDTPQNLGATVNSSANDNVTGFSLDGRTMLMTSTRVPGGQGGNDLWLSTRTDVNNDFGWTAPVNLGPVINSPFTDNSGNFFEDPATGATTLIFSSDRLFMDGITLRFYQSTRNPDGTFNAPVLIDELNGEGSHFGSAIRRDGLEIFIASARPGGFNNGATLDIWTSTRASVSAPWSAPVLVAGINFTAEERQPKLSPDGAVLFFHSNRAGGFGGNDLYSATRCSLYAANAPCNINRTVADFDGDGRADLSVFRPSNGTWYMMQSGTNTFRATQFGINGDKIVPGDYDGDGQTDFAVFRPSDRNWYLLRSRDGFTTVNWGLATDKPVPGDYDGDGRADIAVYRDGVWYILQSSNGQFTTQQFGLSGDIPIAAANVQ